MNVRTSSDSAAGVSGSARNSASVSDRLFRFPRKFTHDEPVAEHVAIRQQSRECPVAPAKWSTYTDVSTNVTGAADSLRV